MVARALPGFSHRGSLTGRYKLVAFGGTCGNSDFANPKSHVIALGRVKNPVFPVLYFVDVAFEVQIRQPKTM
jgi:hypothetical protein